MYVGKRKTRQIITARKRDCIRVAAEKLKEHRIRQIPVAKEGKLGDTIADRGLKQASVLERLRTDNLAEK